MSARVPQSQTCELTADRFDREYYRPQRPVSIDDGASQWPALRKWSPDYFKTTLGRKRVVLNSNSQGVFDRNRAALTGPVTQTQRSFAEAIDLIVSDKTTWHYLQQKNLSIEFPELLPDLGAPGLLGTAKQILVANFWFGARGCKTPLHYDEADNFLIQMFGRKRVMLFPPACSPQLYPALGDINPHASRINVFAPDLTTFPLYTVALGQLLECEIGPGNILYIPKHWWHAVESLDVSASVNLWWAHSKPARTAQSNAVTAREYAESGSSSTHSREWRTDRRS